MVAVTVAVGVEAIEVVEVVLVVTLLPEVGRVLAGVIREVVVEVEGVAEDWNINVVLVRDILVVVHRYRMGSIIVIHNSSNSNNSSSSHYIDLNLMAPSKGHFMDQPL